MIAPLRDLRFAIRSLRKSPGFTLVAVVCIALGIGVNTAIFSIVNALLLRPFPFHEPERIVAVVGWHPRSGDEALASLQDFRDWDGALKSFAAMAAYDQRSLTLTGGEEAERLEGGAVTWDLFPLLGVRPARGRGFRAEEDRPGAAGVVLLSDALWRRRYDADPAIVGRTIEVNDAPHTVVGVMPPRFQFPEREQLWVPLLPLEHASPRTDRSFWVLARLAPGAELAAAQRELEGIVRRLEREHPAESAGWAAVVRPLRILAVGDTTRLVVLTTMGAVTFVLLIACANVANLLLARSSARAREIAIRAALGAGRARIAWQLILESVLIALAGGALGVGLAQVGIDLIDRSIPPTDRPSYLIEWSIDGATLLYTLVVSVVTGVLFGLAPALVAVRQDLQGMLRDGTPAAGTRRTRGRSALVVAEVSLSLVLLVGASLFVRSFLNVLGDRGGVDPAPVMTMRLYLPGDRYESVAARARRIEDIVRRVEGLPAVEGATASNLIPLGGGGSGAPVVVEGVPAQRGEEPRIYYAGVTPHFFRTLGVPIRSGRDFTDAEGRDSSGVAVVSERMAKLLWAGTDPVGRRFRFADDASGHWLTVIGVVPDIRTDEIDGMEEPEPAAYLPYPYLATRNTGLMVRVAGAGPGVSPARVTAGVRAEIRASDPGLPVFEVRTMEHLRRDGFWAYRLFGWMFSIFGAIALGLAAIGVYGVVSFGVAQRTREIGVRVALGAARADVLGLVLRHGLGMAALGVALGLAGAFGVTRVIASILYNVSPTDAASFVGIAVFLGGVALLASYLPARRAMRVDPMVALRSE
jgi:predicted permease